MKTRKYWIKVNIAENEILYDESEDKKGRRLLWKEKLVY